MPEEVDMALNADDLTVLVKGSDLQDMIRDMNAILTRIDNWMHSHGLKISLSKSEEVIKQF